MTTAQATISVLEGWLAQGVHEEPAHSNRTIVGQEFGWNGVAWCAEGCSVATKRAGQAADWSASVAQWIADAKAGKNGMRWISRTDEVRIGDMPCFDWQLGTSQAGRSGNFHISTIVNPGTQAKFETIGCNENDAVTRQWRDRTYVQGFVRPAYDVLVPIPPPTPGRRDTLHHGEGLGVNAELVSASGTHRLILQGDGNVVVYRVSDSHALWSTRTNGRGTTSFAMQDDDNLVAYSGTRPLWSSDTQHGAGQLHARLVMQDDGNAVIYTDANRALWASKQGKL